MKICQAQWPKGSELDLWSSACTGAERGSIPTPGAHSASIPLGKGFTVHYLVFSDGTLNRRFRVWAHITHIKIPSHSSKKSRPLWPVMMDDSAPIHERRKLIKTYKNVLPWKRIVAAKVCGETYSKNDKKKRWIRKTATNVMN